MKASQQRAVKAGKSAVADKEQQVAQLERELQASREAAAAASSQVRSLALQLD